METGCEIRSSRWDSNHSPAALPLMKAHREPGSGQSLPYLILGCALLSLQLPKAHDSATFTTKRTDGSRTKMILKSFTFSQEKCDGGGG